MARTDMVEEAVYLAITESNVRWEVCKREVVQSHVQESVGGRVRVCRQSGCVSSLRANLSSQAGLLLSDQTSYRTAKEYGDT